MKKLIFPIAAGVMSTAVIAFYLLLNPGNLDKAPDISLNSINGQKIDIHSLQGKPLLVTFLGYNLLNMYQ